MALVGLVSFAIERHGNGLIAHPLIIKLEDPNDDRRLFNPGTAQGLPRMGREARLYGCQGIS